jgi:hypothetical protein
VVIKYARVWRVEGGVWSVECGVWSVECGVWSVECGVWSVECFSYIITNFGHGHTHNPTFVFNVGRNITVKNREKKKISDKVRSHTHTHTPLPLFFLSCSPVFALHTHIKQTYRAIHTASGEDATVRCNACDAYGAFGGDVLHGQLALRVPQAHETHVSCHELKKNKMNPCLE